jgi:predicted transcriptional regulator
MVPMATLTMRLDDELDRRLSREAERAEQTRSELARAAITAFLEQQERQRFLDEIARAAREPGGEDPIAIAEEALAADNEALDLAEGVVRQPRAAYRVKRRKR